MRQQPTRPVSSGDVFPADQDLEQISFPDAQLVAAQADDAGASRLDHFDGIADSKAHFVEPVNAVRIADKLVDAGGLARREKFEGKEVVCHGTAAMYTETNSQYASS